jgi:hypothetical protein
MFFCPHHQHLRCIFKSALNCWHLLKVFCVLLDYYATPRSFELAWAHLWKKFAKVFLISRCKLLTYKNLIWHFRERM